MSIRTAAPALLTAVAYYVARRFWGIEQSSQIAASAPDFLAESFAPHLPEAYRSCRLERIHAGRNARVFRLVPEEGEALIAHFWEWNPMRRPAREHARAAGLFAEAGVRAPRVLHWDDSLRSMRRWGSEGVVETIAPGVSGFGAEALLPEIVGAVARDLARLHRMEGGAWGKPWAGHNQLGHPRAEGCRRIADYRRQLATVPTELDSSFIARQLEALERRVKAEDFAARPVLIHGDVHKGNLFIDDRGEITWIDFGTAQYGRFESDLAGARKLFPSPEVYRAFLEAYAAAGGARPDPEAIYTLELLERWRHICSAASKVDRKQAAGKHRPDAIQRLRNAERWLMKVIEAGPALNVDFTPELHARPRHPRDQEAPINDENPSHAR